MEFEYRFPNLPGLEDMSILIRNHNGRIKTHLRSSYSFKTWFFIKLYFIIYDRIGSLANLRGSSVSSMYIPPIPSEPHARIVESYLAAALFDKLIPQAATIGVTTEKILHHPAYNCRSQTCRMQDSEFRKKYIDPIPENADLPFPIDKLPSALNMSGSALP